MKNNSNLQTLFVGIDPHKEQHTLTVINPFGQRVDTLTFNNEVSGFRQALDRLSQLAKSNNLSPLIGIESSGGNGESCAEYFFKQGYQVKTINPTWVRKERLKNTHPEKSDPQDAEEVARALLTRSGRLPSLIVSQNRDIAKDLNLLVKDREELVNEQTRLKNKLHAALQNSWGGMYKTVYQKNIFGIRALKFWQYYPCAREFKRSTSSRYVKPESLKNCGADELPTVSTIHSERIKRMVKRLIELKQEIIELNRIINSLVKKHVPYLTSLPGCGAYTAAKIYAELNDVTRFKNNSKLARYSGIAPVRYESGKSRKNIQSKRGNVRLRQAIKTIALTQIGNNGSQLGKAYYRKKLKQGKTKKQALRCLMRQLTKIIFQMTTEERPYY